MATIERAITQKGQKEFVSDPDQIFDITDRGVNYSIATAHHGLKQRDQEITVDSLIKEAYETKLHSNQSRGLAERSRPAQMVDAIILTALAYPLAVEAVNALEKRGTLSGQEVREAKATMIQFNNHITDCLTYLSRGALTKIIERLVNDNRFIRSKGPLMEGEWESYLKGMGAEVAVRSALMSDDYLSVRPASAVEDSQGSDLIVTSPEGEFALDVKNHGNFFLTLEERGLPSAKVEEALRKGYFIDSSGLMGEIHYGHALVDADYSGVVRGTRYASDGAESCRAHIKGLVGEIIKSNKLDHSEGVARAAVRHFEP